MRVLRLTAAAAALLTASSASAGEALNKAIGAPDWLSVDLTHRTRYEAIHNQPNIARKGDDQLLSLVTFLKVEAGGDHVKLVG